MEILKEHIMRFHYYPIEGIVFAIRVWMGYEGFIDINRDRDILIESLKECAKKGYKSFEEVGTFLLTDTEAINAVEVLNDFTVEGAVFYKNWP